MRETYKTIEAMKQALEALEELVLLFDRTRESECLPMQLVLANAAQKILRAAIVEASKQDVQQEPVAFYWKPSDDVVLAKHWTGDSPPKGWMPLYTHPPRREWVGLTDEDMALCESEEDVRFVLAIEAKLKEKNS